MSAMDAVDWRLVAFSALWLLGLAVALASLSFANYRRSEARVSLAAVLRQPGYRGALNTGLVVFCLGVAGSARAVWEALLWLGLAAAFAWQSWRSARSARP